MSFSTEQIEKIARLAYLNLSSEQADATRKKLDDIFSLIEKMQAVDTSGIEPMSHPQELATRLREDRVTEPDRRDSYQQIAPQTENGLYLVPKVIE